MRKRSIYIGWVIAIYSSAAIAGGDVSFGSSSDDLAPQWAQVFIGVIALLLTTWLGLRQLKIQSEDNIKAQEESTRKTLKLDVYKKITDVLRNATDKEGAVVGYVRGIPVAYRMWQRQRAANQPATVTYRAMEFQRKHTENVDALIDVNELVRQFLVVIDKNFDVFLYAINSQFAEIQRAQTQLFPLLTRFLPMDVPIDGGHAQPIMFHEPTDEEILEISRHIDDYIRMCDIAGGYLEDLLHESQRALVADLFDYEVEIREPRDPEYLVITISPERAQELKDHFLNDTAWGREFQAARARVDAEVRARNA